VKRRTVWTGAVAVGLTFLMVAAPVQAAGLPGGGTAQPSRTGAPAAGKPTIVPVSADVRTSRFAAGLDGVRQWSQETGRFYRDSQGRTREETGSTVTIKDPTTHTILRLDTKNQTFQRSAAQPAPSQADSRQPSAAQSKQITSGRRSLGTAQISGVTADGQTFTVTSPSVKGGPTHLRTVTMWLSTQVQLTVQTRVTDATGYEYSQMFTNIRAGAEPAAALFQVPAGYRDAASATTTRAGVDATCPLFNEPDPLILNSFDWVFLAAGLVNATTDGQIPCLFVADAAAFEYPLWGGPTVPLGLPFDQWVAFDTGGGGLPFLPWPAAGDIAFLVTNGSDTTTKDSLVILTVWPI